MIVNPLALVCPTQKGAIALQFRRLKEVRNNHNFTQKDIAKYLGISQQHYSQYESGKLTISLRYIIQLADLYHTSTDYLLERTNTLTPY